MLGYNYVSDDCILISSGRPILSQWSDLENRSDAVVFWGFSNSTYTGES